MTPHPGVVGGGGGGGGGSGVGGPSRIVVALHGTTVGSSPMRGTLSGTHGSSTSGGGDGGGHVFWNGLHAPLHTSPPWTSLRIHQLT